MSKKKSKFRAGDRVQTNARYERVIHNEEPHVGVLVKEVGWLAGVWLVDVEGFAKPQRIHESMMERTNDGG